MNNEPILSVAVDVPLSRLFDYLAPAGAPCPEAGSRVQVPFGRREATGLVMAVGTESSVADDRIRRTTALIDDDPLLSADDLWLIRFTSDYYHHPIGEVAAAAMPVLLRRGRSLLPRLECFAVADSATQIDIAALGKRAPRQADLLQHLIDAGGDGIDVETLTEQLPNWRRAARALQDKGLITSFERRAELPPMPDNADAHAGPELNDEQRSAVEAVRQGDGFAAFLLDGVTGSGKTEVYLRLIEDVLASGRQALVLVPEIGLTPQLVARFRDRLGFEPVLLHSGLSDIERLAGWRRARSGDAALVVGTRSAVFVPLARPGLIIVDEEHDHSLKQQEGLRYSARDLAIARANHASIPIVLGSATPSLELQKHCEDGNYTRLALPQRAGGATPPTLGIIDLSRAPTSDGLSDSLARAIERHLASDGQVLMFLNRRGFAPTLICSGCAHVVECRRCDSRMTIHAGARRLRCHHCGASRHIDETCGHCGSALRPLGAGTERLEEALRQRFPQASVMRIDSDSTQKKGAMDAALAAATLGDANILVGTQMLSKGHHFPQLTLVGIVNADQGLFGTDFRSDERMAQSIIQVAGRAGREQTRGEVLIQTAFPEHPFWRRLIEGGYAAVSAQALTEREVTAWPPYSRLALIRANAHKRADAQAFLEVAKREVLKRGNTSVRVLGPVDAVMARKAGRYRAHLLLQTNDRQSLHRLLGELRPLLEGEPAARRVRWSVDVDPIELT